MDLFLLGGKKVAVDDSFMNQAESFWFITDSLHGLHSFPLAKSRPWTSSLGGFESGYCFGCTCWANFVPSIFFEATKIRKPKHLQQCKSGECIHEISESFSVFFLVPI